MDILNNIIETTINSFDFSFCISCNVLIYLVIGCVNDARNGSPVKEWTKRLITLIVTAIMGVVYCYQETDCKIVLNSAIITPVFWSWILKPILKYAGYDYNSLTIKNKDNEFN